MHYINVECFFVYIVKDKSIANGRFCHGILLHMKTSRDVNLVSIVGFWLICLNSLRVAQIYGRLRTKLADIHVRVLLLKCKHRCIHWVCSLDSISLYFIHLFISTICICMWRIPVAPGYRPGSLRGSSREPSVFYSSVTEGSVVNDPSRCNWRSLLLQGWAGPKPRRPQEITLSYWSTSNTWDSQPAFADRG